MQEFSAVSVSSYDAAALVAQLNEKSADGWSVVSIVQTGGDVTAFLSRDASASAAPAAAVAPVAAAAPAAAAEPAGWAVAPEPAATQAASQPQPQPAQTYQPAAQTYQAATQQAVQPAVPANWYADPAGRFELRYWDGTQWTEHVSRGGQQFTDPPVA